MAKESSAAAVLEERFPLLGPQWAVVALRFFTPAEIRQIEVALADYILEIK